MLVHGFIHKMILFSNHASYNKLEQASLITLKTVKLYLILLLVSRDKLFIYLIHLWKGVVTFILEELCYFRKIIQ